MPPNQMKKQKSTDSQSQKKEPPTELLSFRPLTGSIGKRTNRNNQSTQNKDQSQRRKNGVPDQAEENQQVQPKSEYKDEPGETIKDAMKRKTGLEAPSVIEQRAKKRQEKQELKEKSKQDEKYKLLNLQIKDEQQTQQSALKENAQQRDQFVHDDSGKLVKIKADSVYHPSSYQCVVMDSSKKRPTQNTYLRSSKRQKSSKWGGSNDEQKFYDALKVFGGDIGMIHSCVFCPKEAQPKYKDPEYFSERSMVQLKNKFRKEQDTINKMIDRKKKHEDMQWFEKKYGIQIMSKPKVKKPRQLPEESIKIILDEDEPIKEDKSSDDNVTDSSVQDDQSQAVSSMEQYASHMSAGLISDRGIAEYTKSMKSNSKYQTSLKSEK